MYVTGNAWIHISFTWYRLFISSVVHGLQCLVEHCSPQAIHKHATAKNVRITHVHTYATYHLIYLHTTPRHARNAIENLRTWNTHTHTRSCTTDDVLFGSQRRDSTIYIQPSWLCHWLQTSSAFHEINKLIYKIGGCWHQVCSRSHAIRSNEMVASHAVCTNKNTQHWYTMSRYTIKRKWKKEEKCFGLVGFWYMQWRWVSWTQTIPQFFMCTYVALWFRNDLTSRSVAWMTRMRDTFHICKISNSIDWHSWLAVCAFGIFFFYSSCCWWCCFCILTNLFEFVCFLNCRLLTWIGCLFENVTWCAWFQLAKRLTRH